MLVRSLSSQLSGRRQSPSSTDTGFNKSTILARCICVLFAVALLSSVHARSQSFPMPQGDPNQNNGQVDCTDPNYSDSAYCSQSPGMNGNPDTGNGDNDSSNNGNQGSGNPGNMDINGYPSVPANRRPGQDDRNQTYTDNGGLGPNGRNRNNQFPYGGTLETPEPPTEFQQLVRVATGRMLPIFGRELFRSVPSTFAPVDQIPMTSDYTIGPGDELLIRVWGQVTFNNRLTVDRNGSIYLPQVGAVQVAGLSYNELEPHLRADIGRVFRNFDLTVNLGQLRSIQVFVVGQVRHPGSYTVSSFSTLINALFAAGGPQSRGSMRHILLKRDGKTVSDFDFYDLLLQGDKSNDSRLQSGDVIFVPPVGPQVAIAGSVRAPAIYELKSELKDGTSIDQLVQMAGGLSTTASSLSLSLERIDERRGRQAMSITLDTAGGRTLLQDGDVVRVVPLSPRYEKSVTIRGNLANPGRFEWHPGMRLSDLIPDRESLLTNKYWEKRNRLGTPSPFFAEPLPTRNRPTPQTGQSEPASGEESSNSSIAGGAPNASSDNPDDPRDLNGPINSGNSSNNAANNEANGNNNGSMYYNNGALNPSDAANMTVLPPRVEVKLPVAEIDWSYAVIERLNPETLKNSLVPFNLGKLVMDHDASQDLALQPGDVVTIFSQADVRVPLAEQTKYVKLEGEFNGAGTYSVLPGETLRQLVIRAGGLTSGAYLYGSDFTRESARVIQQRRLDEYVSQLAVQIERDSANRAATAVSAQDSAAVSAQGIGQRELIARLRMMKASGRIVLELKANSSGIDALPDLKLENGDSFIVPSPPDSVNVVGAVYDQGSFLFNPSRRVHDYLQLSGGFTRSADGSRAFIVRADGSVLSRPATGSFWGNNFLAVTLNPGDTVVVPEKLFKVPALRTLQDISQILSGFGLAAAAVEVLK